MAEKATSTRTGSTRNQALLFWVFSMAQAFPGIAVGWTRQSFT